VEFVVELGDMRVVAIDGEQILGQVVGADREKIHPPRQCLGLIDRRRHLDHDPDRRHLDLIAFFQQFVMGAMDQEQGIVDLADRGDHGQQQPQIVEPDGGAQDRPHLGQKDLGMIEGDADAAPAEKGIGLVHREIGQRLVAADVQGADGHRTRREEFQHMTVIGHLRTLARKAVAHDERQFSAVKPDPGRLFDAERTALRHQTRVQIERHQIAIGGLGW
jgi:hypothetical protein